MIKKFLPIIVTALLLNVNISAEVEPPNYDFSLDAFKTFAPNTSIAGAEKKYGKGEVLTDDKETKKIRYFISHLRYKFPIIVQVQNGIILDFFARLPSYFIHDVFHQTLINRYGKQDKYFLTQEHAVYEWKEKKGIRRVYSGTCTITCFPIYYAAATSKKIEGYIPTVDALYPYAEIKPR